MPALPSGPLGLAVALGLFILAVFVAGSWTERAQLADLRERGVARLELHATLLEQELARYHFLPAAVQLNPTVLAFLRDPQDTAVAEQVARFLETLNAEAGASELYVLDRAGKVLAASNWDEEISFVGVDLSYRPYFQDALRTGLGRFYGIGTTSGEPGYYYAKAIVEGGLVLGVATVKVSLDKLQSPWQRSSTQAAMAVDSEGVVILASEPDWKYRTLEPLPRATLDRVRATRQFEDVPLEPLGIRTERLLDAGVRIISLPYGDAGERHRFLLQERVLAPSDWRMIILSDLEDLAAVTRAAQALAGLGFAAATLLVLFLRQRRRVIRLELAAKKTLEHANLELERKVAERTRDLLAAQDKLVHASRLAALGQMAAVVAHELNQPLAALRTLSDNAVTLLRRGRASETEGNLGMIAQIVDRMAKISSQLKLFASKPKTARRSRLDRTVPRACARSARAEAAGPGGDHDPRHRRARRLAGASRRRPAGAGARQPPGQRPGCLAGSGGRQDRGQRRIRGWAAGGDLGARRRPGHPARAAAAPVRAVLHDQGRSGPASASG